MPPVYKYAYAYDSLCCLVVTYVTPFFFFDIQDLDINLAGDNAVETAGAQTELAPMAGVEVNLLDFALIYSISKLTQNISAHTSFLITW